MNHSKFRLPLVTAALGVAACILRLGLYRFARDEKGLLIPGHPLAIALWVLTAAAAVFVILQIPKQQTGRFCRADDVSVSSLAMVGCLVFAAGLLATVLTNFTVNATMDLLRVASGLLAVPALAAVAFCRKAEKQPFFGFHAIVCIALTLHTISHYSGWSSRPQLQDAFFPMMGCLMLMLFAYYQTASDAGMGSRRMQVGTGLLAVFCSMAAVAESGNQLLYLTGSIWAVTNLWIEPTLHKDKEECQ